MKSPLITIEGERTVQEAALEMDRHRIASIVISKEDENVGILTERDVFERVVQKGLNPKETRVEDVMSTPIYHLDESATVDQAARMMVSLRVKRLLVDRKGRPVGMITINDIMRTLISHHSDVLDTWEKNILEAWKGF